MELKRYQWAVMQDLARFLALLTEKQSAAGAYRTLWEEKGVKVGLDGLPPYHSNLKHAPEVCFKVPTGGGKTFLAANAVKPIFDSMTVHQAKAVVWLVPSDAILAQTLAALKDPWHPYRQKLNEHFSSQVAVYSKQQMLDGQDFNPTAVLEQLSVFVLSYDSFRTSRKEGRKAYQQNGNLAQFAKFCRDPSILLADTDETALIQVIRYLNPVVIVDESHHAGSALSVEMLRNFNPCFVLDLTATPRKNSNIISFVDAAQLKKENMVKLPVIVYNRKSQADVYSDAINIRNRLEAQAAADQRSSGRYIRPIVLFQAQSNIGTNSTTYQKIKDTLVEAGIPEAQIAVKTADKDELKGVDLLSPDCPVRYIITVNALKEGWDCPFAYVLATVANRTSAVDVEQILGRVLRLPYTRKNESNVLNLSYVITSSADFHGTLERVVSGLNSAGFSSRDYRTQDDTPPAEQPPQPEQLPIEPAAEPEDEVPAVDPAALRERIEPAMEEGGTVPASGTDEMLAAALAQNDAYEEELENAGETAIDRAPMEVREKMNVFRMNEDFREEAARLRFPQFMREVGASFFSDEYIELKLDHLSPGFTLKDKDVQIDFTSLDAEMARIDVEEGGDDQPRAWMLQGMDSSYFKEWFNARPSHFRLVHCKGLIRQKLSKVNCINDRELQEYIDRVVETMTEDQVSDFEQSPYPYVVKVESKVKELLAAHRARVFDLWLEQGKVVCRPNYVLPSSISPTTATTIIPKSLYSGEEGNMNEYERKVVWALSSMEQIKWWHRNISRQGFQINGSTHAYPDIIAMTVSGKILMIETKGDHLDNDESKEKARIGARWASLAGNDYRYYMVFQTKQPDYPGAVSYDRFMEILKGM